MAQLSLRKNAIPKLAPLAVLVLLSSPACRAEWKISPNVGINETYTDNVNLTTDAQATREFITELTPGITISDNGPNLKLNAVYTGTYFDYSNKDVLNTNQFQSALQANANASIIKEFFYIDSAASISQQSISAFGPQVNNNPYSSTNRTEVKTLTFSPYLTHNFGTTAVAEVRYTHEAENSGNVILGDSQSDGILFNLASGPSFRQVNWDLQYNRQTIENTVAATLTDETASMSGAYVISPQFSLTANTGFDEFNYQGSGTENPRDYFWLTGFAWAPTTRTNIQLSGGRRYGGTAYTLAAKIHSSHSVWSINYNDSVTSTLSQFASPSNISTAALLTQLDSATISDPTLLQQTVANQISQAGLPSTLPGGINLFNNSFFLQKQLVASAAFNTARTTLVFSLFDTETTTLSPTEANGILFENSNLLLNNNNRQLGGSTLLNWELTPRSNFYLNVNYAKTQSLSTDLNSYNRAVVFGMTRHIKPKLQGSLLLRHDEGTAADGVNTYHENAVVASLTLQL